eukprot:CAMPEP_0194529496 /NCGR_PEP_ID=MMETSP0253-20130528/66207_1 /TAXON_ID=2966 /ORGANISM="Noctiluca scintillans" /LENGTH=141 /DNA_ID=CAMNT_0039374641 /DNA_START=22 /DNA_END=447 /DNA_ORIENTATION=-
MIALMLMAQTKRPIRPQHGLRKVSNLFCKLMRTNASRTWQDLLQASTQRFQDTASSGAPEERLETSSPRLLSMHTVTVLSHSVSSASVGSSRRVASEPSAPSLTPTDTLKAVACMATPASSNARNTATPATEAVEPSLEQI